jgi:hypothetical protein
MFEGLLNNLSNRSNISNSSLEEKILGPW